MLNIIKIPALCALLLSAAYANRTKEAETLNQADYYKATDNPAEHVKKFAQCRLKEMYQIEVDINNDGKKEILIGTTQYEEDIDVQVEPPGWFDVDIFTLNAEGKYECTKSSIKDPQNPDDDDLPLLQTDLFHGFIPELKCHGILLFHFGRRPDDECWIEALVLDGKNWKIVPVIKGIMETHEEQLLKRCVNPLALKEIDLSKPAPAPAQKPAPAVKAPLLKSK